MNRRITAGFAGLALALVLAVPAAAHSAAPCNDTDLDGSASGREYATHHIRPLATDGALGAGGHKPGAHRGFSLCLGVH